MRTPATRTWLVAGIVVVHAAVQTLLVVGDPVPAPGPGFVLRAAASAVAVLVAVVAVTLLVSRGRGRTGAVTVTAVGVLVLAVAAALIDPPASAAVLLVGAAVLPAVALGARPGARIVTAVRHHPVAAAAWVSGVVVLLVLTYVSGVVAGLLLGTPVAAAAIGVIAGAVAAVVLAVTVELLRRPTTVDDVPAARRGARGDRT